MIKVLNIIYLFKIIYIIFSKIINNFNILFTLFIVCSCLKTRNKKKKYHQFRKLKKVGAINLNTY